MEHCPYECIVYEKSDRFVKGFVVRTANEHDRWSLNVRMFVDQMHLWKNLHKLLYRSCTEGN